ncbi:hypothetical protein [Nocardia sp. NPDC050710]|uniref:hypothetical protein n=1 Tax=Nocardia sp. NPDC050710 TaxID=3157220 RepID=UPI0033C2829D
MADEVDEVLAGQLLTCHNLFVGVRVGVNVIVQLTEATDAGGQHTIGDVLQDFPADLGDDVDIRDRVDTGGHPRGDVAVQPLAVA